MDLVSGIAVRDVTDDATGMTQKIVTDWRSAPKGNDLKPEIIVVDANGEPVRNDAGNPVTYPMSVDAILSVEDGQDVKAGDVVARIPREGAKTKDITGGLPRVAELFEARRPKDHAIIAEMDGYVRFGKDYKNKRRITIEPSNEGATPVEYMVPKGKHIPVQEGDFVQRGDYIMDGNPAPHDILRILGIEALADYLIDEVQDVYRLQGVKINDKHIEVIVRQMLQKIEILDSGESTFSKERMSIRPNSKRRMRRSWPVVAVLQPANRFCSASPRRRSRPARSSRQRRSKRPPVFSPRLRCRANAISWLASKRTSSSVV